MSYGLDLADLSKAAFPIRAGTGYMWAVPIVPPENRDRRSVKAQYMYTTCANCPREGRCREAVARGDFIGCEWPLVREVEA